MNTHDERDDERLERVLGEIRKAGTPYPEEPDPRYWSNFRMRVMERVEAEEARRQPIRSKIWQWITERPVRAGLIGFSTAALVLVGVLTNPFSSAQPDVAVIQPKVATVHHDSIAQKPTVSQHIALAPKSPVDVQTQKEMAATTKAVRKMLNSKEYTDRIKRSVAASEETRMAEVEQTQSVSTVTTAPSDLPVSLDELSESQLEDLLHSLETKR